ncbi:MAG: glutamate-1-semialdehyde 2,1-aminomutase [Candidatus Eremiobacteraeota bacterium]|nr:glutamate-1-semialdehyde 2,1-aminomutase [Candidatus Eremiobacteraeota bacterium]
MSEVRRSRRLFEHAQTLFPGGVNSPVRAFGSVGGTPRVLVRGEGPRVYDADGNSYIDYVASWGPLILGHSHPSVVRAIERAAADGTSFGAPNPHEIELAELIREAMPSLELLRFVSSGTEACMSAIRLARAYTGREMVLKFAGCYHGHADAMLVQAGSGGLTFGVPSSAGVPAALAALTIVAPYNDAKAVERAFREHDGKIACVIVEPIAANMGLVLPERGFLQHVVDIAHRNDALVIFDEVITGFRIAHGGAQNVYGIRPDLTCLGKIIGAGMPAGAFGGRADIMRRLAPSGDVYQAGTLSGNPVAMAAGAAQLRELRAPGVYDRLEALGSALQEGLHRVIADLRTQLCVYRVGSIFGLFFIKEHVHDLATVLQSDAKAYAQFFHALLERGVALAPSAYEVGFISTAHSTADIQDTVDAVRAALSSRGAVTTAS